MFLIFDTSANGMPRKWSAPADDTFNWPRMIHLAWEVYDNDRKLIASEDLLVKPQGWKISQDYEKRTGVSQIQAEDEGKPLKEVLETFHEVLLAANMVISHNLNFNQGVLGAEFYRNNMKHELQYKDAYCLMQESTWYCKLPGKGGRYKWPSNTELFMKLFGAKYEGANNAKADVLATSASFFRMLELGELDDIFEED